MEMVWRESFEAQLHVQTHAETATSDSGEKSDWLPDREIADVVEVGDVPTAIFYSSLDEMKLATTEDLFEEVQLRTGLGVFVPLN